MNRQDFEDVLRAQMDRVTSVLINKNDGYNDGEDKLRSFKTASAIEHVTTEQALAGMMVKHTVSVYDMIYSGKSYDLGVWDEKITDHINYLILLRAILQERAQDEEEINTQLDQEEYAVPASLRHAYDRVVAGGNDYLLHKDNPLALPSPYINSIHEALYRATGKVINEKKDDS